MVWFHYFKATLIAAVHNDSCVKRWLSPWLENYYGHLMKMKKIMKTSFMLSSSGQHTN